MLKILTITAAMALLAPHTGFAAAGVPTIPSNVNDDAAGLAAARNAALSRLALAEALIQSLDAGFVCDTDAYPSEIVDLVSQASAVFSPAEMQKWAAKIPADSKIRRNFAFWQAIDNVAIQGGGLSVAALEKALQGKTFFRFGSGVFGSQYNITFEAGGQAKTRRLEMREVPPDDPTYEWVAGVATWSVTAKKTGHWSRLFLIIDGTEFQFEEKQGEVWLVPTTGKPDENIDRTLSSSDSFCEA